MEQIQLSNVSFEGDNNVYLFDEGPETVLVDTGDWLPDTRNALESALAAHGTGFADIDRIFLTHWHGDHVGLAGDIQAESGATVHVHEADAPLVAGDDDAWDALKRRQEDCFEHWGMPESGRDTLRDILAITPIRENAPTVTPLSDGDTFSVGDRTVEAVHAPGHAAGLCLYDIGDGAVLTGDALLPVYTPNVGGADVRVEEPLARYLETLDAIAAAEYDLAWPGHRDVIDDPTARAVAIRDHHEKRAWRVLDVLRRRGPSDAWTVSADLFGDLEHIHILHGPGEASAHLDHLERAGNVERDGSVYHLADGVEEKLETGTERWALTS